MLRRRSPDEKLPFWCDCSAGILTLGIESNGFESGSQRTLAAMRKGADLGRAERILARCRELAIGTNLQCFLGFPGESRADALATLRFLERVRGPHVTVSCGLFELQKGSPLHADPGRWNVRVGPAALTPLVAVILSAHEAGVTVAELLAPLASRERRRVKHLIAALARRGLVSRDLVGERRPTRQRS